MEDNEFEEVTIISHTDHGTSMLSESTSLKLLGKTTLEVTQEIGLNGNIKTRYLENNSQPTLLDSVYRDIIKNEDEDKRTAQECWLSLGRSREPGSPWLMFTKPYLFRADTTSAAPLATRLGSVYFIQEWLGNFICFPQGTRPKVIDRHGAIVKEDFTHEFYGYINSGVSSTATHCYFSNMDSQIVGLDSDLVETVVPGTAEVEHFQVCWLTQSLVIVNTKGEISRGPVSRPVVEYSEEDMKKYYLKQMHLGHFILTVGSSEENNLTLHLLHKWSLDNISQLSIPCITPYVPGLLNLLKPTRSGGHPFLLTGSKSLHLMVVIGPSIHKISEIDINNYVYCFGFDSDNNWIVGSTGVNLTSVRVCLPKRLAL